MSKTPKHEYEVPRYRTIKCNDPEHPRFGRYITILVDKYDINLHNNIVIH